MKEGTNERTNERTNDQTIKRTNERTNNSKVIIHNCSLCRRKKVKDKITRIGEVVHVGLYYILTYLYKKIKFS